MAYEMIMQIFEFKRPAASNTFADKTDKMNIFLKKQILLL